jgi:hypothetical protein
LAETKPPRLVKFIQYEEPPLKAGEYKVTVTHRVEVGKRPDPAPARAATPGPPGPALRNEASATRTFAVAGERYILDDGDIVSLFPPNGSTGEFSGVLPHVLFSKGTLPWERDSVPGDPASPWLAVLSFGTEELAALGVQSPAVQGKKAKDLVPLDEPVTVAGSKAAPGKGELPANTLSYPATEDDGKWVLDYVSVARDLSPVCSS